MPLDLGDRGVVYRTLRALSQNIRNTQKELSEECSPEIREALEAWRRQLIDTAIEWMDRGQGDVPAQIMESGCAELVERMPLAGPEPVLLQAGEVQLLAKTFSASYIDLCISRGLATNALPLLIIDRLHGMPAKEKAAWLAMLERPELNQEMAVGNGGQTAWRSMSDYYKAPELKIAFLKKQIAAFPEAFEEMAGSLSRQPRKCGPLLILALCGVRVANLEPAKGEDVSARRMQFLCSKLSSNHGLLQLRAEFSPIEKILPDMQAHLDSWFRKHGIHG